MPAEGTVEFLLCQEYRKHLLGVPFEKLKLSDAQKEKLRVFMKNYSPGRSAADIYYLSEGKLSSHLCWQLKQTQKATRHQIKAARDKFTSNRSEKMPEVDPLLCQYIQNNFGKPRKIVNKSY